MHTGIFYRANHLYWGDVIKSTIMRSSLDGTNRVTMVDTSVYKPGTVGWEIARCKLWGEQNLP